MRDSEYPAKSFDTGHPAYDRFLAGAKEWPPNYRALDPPEARTRAAILREMPFVAPIVVLVFLGAFIPVVGATISGIAAVAVALVDGGPVVALIMLAGVIAVQQIESHVLQPFLMGRLVRVHPLAVVLAIATGTVVAGIFGALIAVPLVAIVNTVGGYLAGEREPLDAPDFGVASDPAVTR